MSERSAARGLCWGTFASPVGELRVGCSDDGVAAVSFGPPRTRSRRRDSPLAGQGQRPVPSPGRAAAVLACALRQLGEYFSRQRRGFELPVDWSGLSQTHCRVLRALQECAGYGVTVSYGELARRAGLTDAPGQHLPPARVVGQVMGANRCPIIVPCHRVVAGDGLGGYSGGAGVEIKRWLLTFEGSLPPTLDWDPAGPAG